MPKSARPLIVPVGALLVVIAAVFVEIGCQSQSASKPTASQTTTPAPAAEKKAEPDPDDSSNFNDYGEPMRPGADFPVTTAFVRDTRTFKIAPLDGVEFNFRMEKGGTMVYSWTSSDTVAWDFHGEPKGAKAGFAESYATGKSKEANGGFMAPTSGIHGWFWQNPSDKNTLTVTLKTAGHFTEVLLTMPDDSRAPQPINPR
jgi:hypothetical protein